MKLSDKQNQIDLRPETIVKIKKKLKMIDIEVKHPTVQFTKQDVENILALYDRTLDTVEDDVDCLKVWLTTQPHLKHIPDDRVLFNMLIRNKFFIEKTKKKLDYYYTSRAMISEVFAVGIPSSKEVTELRKFMHSFTLPKLLNCNRVVGFVIEEIDYKPNGYACIAKFLMDGEGTVYSDIHKAVEFIYDFTTTNFAFWSAFNLTMMKIVINVAERMYSNRAEKVRIIGLPGVAQALMTSVLACLPQKLRNRVSMHKSAKEMAEFYPKELLPIEFGGTGRPYREMSAEFNKMIDQLENYFQHIQNFKVDETLRPTKLDNDEILGYHGNFRKLEVD